MALYTIKIHVVPRPGGAWGIRVTPNRQRARWKDEIQWVCQAPGGQAPFVVYFGSSGPMASPVYAQTRPKGKVKYRALFSPCIFKYFVGVYYRNEVKLLDPELEIVP